MDKESAVSEARRLVKEFFEGNSKKARLWFKTPNPLLGDLSPNDLIALGRHEKLLSFIRLQLDENVAPEYPAPRR